MPTGNFMVDQGDEKPIKKRYVECNACGGAGQVESDDLSDEFVRCETCGGVGEICELY